jgi:hypothetical protein
MFTHDEDLPRDISPNGINAVFHRHQKAHYRQK